MLGTAESVAASGAYRPFYRHSVGHWLGMDTHDVASVGHDTPLQPGVSLTIEPGIYIPDEDKCVPSELVDGFLCDGYGC